MTSTQLNYTLLQTVDKIFGDLLVSVQFYNKISVCFDEIM